MINNTRFHLSYRVLSDLVLVSLILDFWLSLRDMIFPQNSETKSRVYSFKIFLNRWKQFSVSHIRYPFLIHIFFVRLHDTVFGFFSLMNVYFTVLANAKFNFILLYFLSYFYLHKPGPLCHALVCFLTSIYINLCVCLIKVWLQNKLTSLPGSALRGKGKTNRRAKRAER